MRHPATSQVALVEDRPEYDYNPGCRVQPESDVQFRANNFVDGKTCHICESAPGHYKVGVQMQKLAIQKVCCAAADCQ